MDTVVIGKIGAPYGVRGWVKIHSYTDPADNIFSYPLLIKKQDEWIAIDIKEYKRHGTGFVASLATVEDRDAAALYTNLKLAVLRENLPEPEAGEYYYADLLGLEVYNQQQVHLGTVVDFFETGANDVLVVKGDKKEHLIPLVFDVHVLAVNLTDKNMQVDWDAEL